MNVLYDYQIYQLQKFGGISKYHTDLYTYLNLSGNAKCTLPILYTNNEYVRKLPEYSNTLQFNTREYKGNNKITRKIIKQLNSYRRVRLKNQQLTIRMLEEKHFDILHPTYYDNYILPHIGKRKLIITIHDMIHELFPEYIGINNTTILLKRKLIMQADRIIAVSKNTKKDLLNIYNIDPDKIDVIHLGVTQEHSENTDNLSEQRKSYDYILYVGNRNSYKNFYTFVYAIEQILIREPNLKLLCTGPSFNHHELKLFNRLGINEKVVHEYMNESNMKSIYSAAKVFVFPSMYEGFGLPILEAFANKCPCLLSELDTFKEVADDSALYFNPKDYQSIYTKTETILNRNKLRKELIANGTNRLKLFSLESMTSKTLQTYQTV